MFFRHTLTQIDPRLVLVVVLAGCDCGAPPPAIDAGVHTTDDAGTAITDAAVEPDTGSEPSCATCPAACIVDRCASETCVEPTYASVEATFEDLSVVGMDADGAHLYVADPSEGLVVLDASVPASLTRVGAVALPGARELRVADDYAYVVAEAELHVVAVADPTVIDLRSSLDVWGSTVAIADELLVITGGDRIQILDRSDPERPAIAGELALEPTAGGAVRYSRGAAAIGTLVYVGSSDAGVLLVDVSDPSAPAIVGTLGEGETRDVLLEGSELFRVRTDGIDVYDVSDPRAPRFVSAIERPIVGALLRAVSSGGSLYALSAGAALGVTRIERTAGEITSVEQLRVPGSPTRVATAGRWAYVGTHDTGIHAIDLAQADAAAEIPLEHDAIALAAAGATLYVAEGEDGLEIVELRALPATTALGRIDRPAYDVALDGDRLWLSEGDALVLYDRAVPESPAELARISIADLSMRVDTRIVALSADGGRAVAATKALTNGELFVVDARGPGEPEIVHQRALDITTLIDDVLLSGDRLVAVESRSSDVKIYGLGTPSSPDLLGNYDGRDLLFPRLSLSGSELVVADRSGSIEVVDLSDLARPRALGSYEGGELFTSALLDRDRVYATSSNVSRGLFVFAAGDLSAPVARFGTYRLPPGLGVMVPADVALAGRFGIVANGSSLLVVPLCR